MEPGNRVVGGMEDKSGPDAAALDGQVGNQRSEHKRAQRLLQDLMRQGEEQAAHKDRPPFVSAMPQAGKNEAAKRQLFADRRQQAEKQQRQPPDGRLLQSDFNLLEFFAARTDRIEALNYPLH